MNAKHLHSLIMMEHFLDAEIERLDAEYQWESKKLVYLQALECDPSQLRDLTLNLQRSGGLITMYKCLLEDTFQERVMYMDWMQRHQGSGHTAQEPQQSQPERNSHHCKCQTKRRICRRKFHQSPLKPKIHERHRPSSDKMHTVPKMTKFYRKHGFKVSCRYIKQSARSGVKTVSRCKSHSKSSCLFRVKRSAGSGSRKTNNTLMMKEMRPKLISSMSLDNSLQSNMQPLTESRPVIGQLYLHDRIQPIESETAMPIEQQPWMEGEELFHSFGSCDCFGFGSEESLDFLQNEMRL